MTATRHVTIWCDYIGPHPSDHPSFAPAADERCVEWTDHGMSTAKGTRRTVAGEGWRHRDGRDLCPRHAR